MSEVRLSVIIPTKNRLNLLKRLLESVASQSLSHSSYDVIVVDDGSTDGTESFVRSVSLPFALRYVKEEGVGPPRARNAGLAVTQSPVVAFMDDDVWLEKHCMERALSYFDDPKVGIVETFLMIEGENRPLQRHSTAQGLVTAAMFCRNQALVEIGGFDPQFFDPQTGIFFRDDADLGFRILQAGYRALQPKNVVAWHPVPFSSIQAGFAHVKRYMFDPLLYRKHPKMFRRYIERKRIGPLTFSRPTHYSCLAFAGSVAVALWCAAAGNAAAATAFLVAAAGSHFVLRFKFAGRKTFHVWDLGSTAAYSVLPLWYLYWFGRGMIKFGGWKSIF